MIESKTHTLRYSNGEIQRVQSVLFDRWDQAEFISPPSSATAFPLLCDLYEHYIIPRCPWIFGQLVLFRLPEGQQVPFPTHTERYGSVADPLTAAAIALRRCVTVVGRRPLITDPSVAAFWRELEETGSIRIISGFLPNTTILPVRNNCGFLSEVGDSSVVANTSFFIMDRFDCASAYDAIGTPLGLQVRAGHILSPPLYRREALMVSQDGSVHIGTPGLEELEIDIDGHVFHPGENAVLHTRPGCRKTPLCAGTDLVIIENRVAAVHPGGGTMVPSSGFVLSLQEAFPVEPGIPAVFRGMEKTLFALQVGNSLVIEGKKTERFQSPFYNIRRLWTTSYPPSLYPLDYEKDRAPRMALGENGEGRPMLVWAEGAGKLHYFPGEDSCGASLSEMADICQELGMRNGINLDGGGSAQILLHGKRALQISDRRSDNSEAERAVPCGLCIR